MRRRLLSALLTLTLVMSLLSNVAFATEGGTKIETAEIKIPPVGGIDSISLLDDVTSLQSILDPNPQQEYSERFYYAQLNKSSKAMYDAMYEAFKDGPKIQDVTITPEQMAEEDRTVDATESDAAGVAAMMIVTPAVGALVHDYPEFSWLVGLDAKASYSTETVGDTKSFRQVSYRYDKTSYAQATTRFENAPEPTTSADPPKTGYADTGTDLVRITEEIEKAKTKISEKLPDTPSEYDKAKAIHDWICENIEYAASTVPQTLDWRGYQTAYSALVEKVTVCAGYSKSMKLLCDEFGIPCVIVSGYGGSKTNSAAYGPHAWNYVRIGDEWYGVDCTWDDQKETRYNYFLKGKQDFITGQKNAHAEGTFFDGYAFAYPVLSDGNHPDIPHTSPSLWQKDATYHWAECTDDDCTTEIREEHKWNEGTVSKEPTASTAGEKMRTCEVCGYEKKESIPPKGHICTPAAEWSSDETYHWHACTDTDCSEASDRAEHNWGEWEITKTPTCTEKGTKTRTCSVCQKTTDQDVDSLGHSLELDTRHKSDANNHFLVCKRDGCDQSVSEPHTFGPAQTTPATCTEAQKTTRVCTKCQYEDVQENDSALGHVFTYTDETRTSSEHWQVCTRCHERTTSEAHDMQESDRKSSTCTEQGHIIKSCVCGYTTTESLPLAEHSTGDWQKNDTEHWKACSTCNNTELYKSAHEWNDGEVTKAPTATETGTKTWTCKDCGATKIEEIPMSHQHTYEKNTWESDSEKHWIICDLENCGQKKEGSEDAHEWKDGEMTKASTCTEEGAQMCICDCGRKTSRTVPALGHEFAGGYQYDDSGHWQTCSRCSTASTLEPHTTREERIDSTCQVAGTVTTICDGCGYRKIEDLALADHTPGSWQDDKTNDQHWKACTLCNNEIAREAHTWKETITKEPTAETAGEKKLTCTICDAIRIESIAPHQHQFDDNHWGSDEFQHWRECTVEGCVGRDSATVAAHGPWTNGAVSKQPTCTETGTRTDTCDICGRERISEVPANGHSIDEDKWEADAENHWHRCDSCTEITDSTAHTWGANNTCTVCGQTKSELPSGPDHTHVYAAAWSMDNDQHWHVCTVTGCKQTSDKENHSWDEGEVTTSATETTPGTTTWKCTVCGQTRTGVIPPTGDSRPHTHAWAAAWSGDTVAHWHNCTAAGCPLTTNASKDGYGAHVWSASGTCTICGQVRSAGYTIVFNANGGAGTSTLTTNSEGRLTQSLPVPTRTGYTFLGWFEQSTGGAQITTQTVFTRNMVVYASWQQNSTGNQPGTGGTGNQSGTSGTPGSSVPPLPSVNYPSIPMTPVPGGTGTGSSSPAPSAQPSGSAGTSTNGPGGSSSVQPSGPAPGASDAPIISTAASSPLELEVTTYPDVEGEVLSGIPISTSSTQTTIEQLYLQIRLPQGASLEVRTADGQTAPIGQRAATGQEIYIFDKDGNTISKSTILIMGDVTGSGTIDLTQLVRIARAYSGTEPLRGIYKQAALHTGGSEISLTDLVIEARMYRGASRAA